MRSKKFQQKQRGFSLIELLIVVVMISIFASIAILYGPAVIKGSKDKLSRTRLATISDAQNRFKSGMGKGRFGSLCELARTPTEDGSVLLPTSVAKFDEGCAPIAIDGWYVQDDIGAGDPTQNPALRKTYLIQLRKEDSETERFCMGPDGILRKPKPGRGGGGGTIGGSTCTMSSPEVEQ
jgi:prepilin-type N-terminal cleavage/methylation domain-containing protein